VSPEPIEFEMKKSLSELLMICWASMADGGMVGAMKSGAKGGSPVYKPGIMEGESPERYALNSLL
jgi:hypothetical protein